MCRRRAHASWQTFRMSLEVDCRPRYAACLGQNCTVEDAAGPRVNINYHPLRARGRCWPGRGLPVATGSLANESGRAKTALGGALTSFVTLARARAFSKFSGPARCCSTGSGRLGGAAAAGGGRDALSYGVSFATTRSHQLARGAPACFLSGISGWFSLSLGAGVPKNLARRKMASAPRRGALRVSNWIVQRLYNYAVKKTVEL